MSKMRGAQPEGYFEYVVPPLEGLWWCEEEILTGSTSRIRASFAGTAMIRQPDFVTADVILWAKGELARKKTPLTWPVPGLRAGPRGSVCR